jgi:hypothetical protein
MIDLTKIEQELGQKIFEDNDPFRLDIVTDTMTITGIALDENGDHYSDVEICSYKGNLSDQEKVLDFFMDFLFEKHKHIEMLSEYKNNFIYNLQEERDG